MIYKACGRLAFFAARLPCLWFAVLPPSPRPPSRWGRGRFFSLFRRGLRPRHPCIKPFATLTELAKQVPSGGLPPAALAIPATVVPCGGLVLFAACLPCLWFDFLPPSPQPPSPAGKGEIFLFSYARGFAPCIPGIKPPAAFTVPAAVVPGGGLNPSDTGSTCQSGIRQGLAFGIASSPQNRQRHFPMSGAGSQGEGGPGERNFGV